MDIWHRIGYIFRLSNFGAFVFLFLNIGLMFLILLYVGLNEINVLIFVSIYALIFAIGLSPIGEWIFSLSLGAKKIKRNDIKLKLYPLLDIVQEQAIQRSPYISKNIKLKIIQDDTINAFAVGRRTICVTRGLLNLEDEEIMSILAHEFGHIAYRHTLIQVLVTCSNVLVSIFLLIIKILCWIIAGFFSLFSFANKSYISGIIITLCAAFSSFLIWLWTKFCLLFLRWSMRENEYLADEYAYLLGYGNMLASVLDRSVCTQPQKGFLKALYSTHPSNDNRIAKLQKLGVEYSIY